MRHNEEDEKRKRTRDFRGSLAKFCIVPARKLQVDGVLVWVIS